MLVLALDTSTPVGSVALLSEKKVLGRAAAEVKGKHGELLIGTISRCLEEAERELSAVELLAVGIGPGSFTGVRVGVATIKGLAIANRLPVVGVVSLAAIARAVGPGRGVVAPMAHAQRGEIYAAVYERGADGPVERVPPFHALPSDAAERIREAARGGPLLAVGDGYRRFETELKAALGAHEVAARSLDLPAADAVAIEGYGRFLARGPDDTSALEPLYVRPSDAKLPAVPLELGADEK